MQSLKSINVVYVTRKKNIYNETIRFILTRRLRGWLLLHARSCHRLKKLFNLWRTSHEFMAPELERWVLDEVNEGYQETPWVWTIHNEALQQDPCYLFLDGFCVGLGKQVQQCAAEVMGMTVWVPQLVCNCIQEKVPSFGVQVNSQVLEYVHV